MGYPDTFEGFMISDQKKWTEFSKQEVRPSTAKPWLATDTNMPAVQAQEIRR